MYTCGAKQPNRAEIECWSKAMAKVLSSQAAKMIKHKYERLAIVLYLDFPRGYYITGGSSV